MAIDRTLWNGVIKKHYAPAWPCPACTTHRLTLKRDSLHSAETTESRRKRHREDFNELDVEFTFSAMLECSNNSCKQAVSCCGYGGLDPYENTDENNVRYMDFEKIFMPKYFWPSLVLFSAPRKCRDSVKQQLTLSFQVFFCDLGAAANHVRSCIDQILTDRNISRETKNGRWRPLGDRIDDFKKIDSANAEFADALKWIGNFGSHPGDLKKDDIFDAYDILELLLEDLYVGHRRATQNKVAKINERRRPLSAST